MATYNLTPQQQRIIAYTVLGEAAGEGARGMKAVAQVIKNRASSGRFPSDPAAVATQHNSAGIYQFSTWNTAQFGGNSPISRYSSASSTYKEAYSIVGNVFGSDQPDPTEGATHFYSTAAMSSPPYWWDSEAKGGYVQIGNHRFAVPTRSAQTVAIGSPPSPALSAYSSRGAEGPKETEAGLAIRRVTAVQVDPVTGLPTGRPLTAIPSIYGGPGAPQSWQDFAKQYGSAAEKITGTPEVDGERRVLIDPVTHKPVTTTRSPAEIASKRSEFGKLQEAGGALWAWTGAQYLKVGKVLDPDKVPASAKAAQFGWMTIPRYLEHIGGTLLTDWNKTPMGKGVQAGITWLNGHTPIDAILGSYWHGGWSRGPGDVQPGMQITGTGPNIALASGSVAPVNTVFRPGASRYTYRVQPDGSVTNLNTGHNSGLPSSDFSHLRPDTHTNLNSPYNPSNGAAVGANPLGESGAVGHSLMEG